MSISMPPILPAIRWWCCSAIVISTPRRCSPSSGISWQPMHDLSLDLAAFRNRYTGWPPWSSARPSSMRHGQIIYPLFNENLTTADSTGLEGLALYSPLAWWRLSVNYSYIDMSWPLWVRTSTATGSSRARRPAIRSACSRTSICRMACSCVRDCAWSRRSSACPRSSTAPATPDIRSFDLNAIWHATAPAHACPSMGADLLHASHVEFGDAAERSAIRRSVYGRVTWQL